MHPDKRLGKILINYIHLKKKSGDPSAEKGSIL